MTFFFGYLQQNWHELDFNLGGPDDLDRFPISAPAAILLMLAILLMAWKGRRNYMALPELLPGGESTVNATVIIPARNEEENIVDCVRSFRNHRVIVVDDHSEDRTAQLAAQAGAEVIAAPPLAKGVMGKPNACFAGAQQVATPYLCFVDADTRFAPEFLSSAVKYADENQVVMVSAFLRQETVTAFEKMLLPYAFGLYFCGVNAKRVHDVTKNEFLANGQCMVFLRDAYEFVGSHQNVNTSVIEDVAMAMKLKRHRMKFQIARAERLGRVRMYDSLGSIWRGFKKNSFRFLQVNKRTGVQVMLTSILLTSIFPMAVWLIMEAQWVFLAMLLMTPLVAFRAWYGGVVKALWVYPAIPLFQLIAIDGMVSTVAGLKTVWKGRPV